MKYNKNLFQKGNSVLLATEVEQDMIIALSKNRYFYVYDIDSFFINDTVAKLYNDDVTDEDIKPEHSILTFYDEDDNEITNIPGTAYVIAFGRIDGKHSPFCNDEL